MYIIIQLYTNNIQVIIIIILFYAHVWAVRTEWPIIWIYSEWMGLWQEEVQTPIKMILLTVGSLMFFIRTAPK